MDLLQLRSHLETLLATDLGTYVLPNGSTTPALAVRNEGESLPAHTKVTGLEVVILAQPSLVPVLQYEAQGTLRDWTLYLVDWDGTLALDAIAAELLYAFAGSTVSPLAAPRQVGPSNQLALRIPSSTVLLNYVAPTAAQLPLIPASFVIPAPVAGAEVTLFRTDAAVTLTAVTAVVQGTSSPSVTLVLKHALDRTAAGTPVTISAAVTNTTTGASLALGTMPIPADSYVWVELSAVSGSVTEVALAVET